jgi:hypothetical protein
MQIDENMFTELRIITQAYCIEDVTSENVQGKSNIYHEKCFLLFTVLIF